MAMIWPAPAMRAPWMTLRPTPPHPMTATVSPGAMSAVFNDGPDPGEHPAPEQGGEPEREVVGDLHDADGGDDGELCERPGERHLLEFLTVGGGARRAVEQP